MDKIKVKKIAPLLLSMILCSSSVLADSVILGNDTLSLTHREIFEVYKEYKIVYDQNNIPKHYKDAVTAVSMTLKNLDNRLIMVKNDITSDYLSTNNHEEKSFKKLDKTIRSLRSAIVNLNKVREGYLHDDTMIDKYYSMSVASNLSTGTVLKRTKRMSEVGDIRSGYAHELNLISQILIDISYGYKDKSLRLILDRGDVTNAVETPNNEVLHFIF